MVIFITILHMNKQKYKEVTEFGGSHRTVRLKKKKKRKDCTQVCLIPKFTGLTMRSFFFLPCWWEEVGFGRRELCSAPSCSYISCVFQKDSRARPRRQGPNLCCQPVAPAHSSSAFSPIKMRTHNSPWDGRGRGLDTCHPALGKLLILGRF